MAVFLLPVSFGAVAVAVYLHMPRNPAMPRFRTSWITAHWIHTLLLTVSTECLSAFRLITFKSIFVFWLLVILISGIFIGKALRTYRFRENFKINLASYPWVDSALLLTVIILGAGLALGGFGNRICLDGQNYHLPRIFYWIQNQNVGFYPSHNLRQLHISPGFHFTLLHGLILGGNYFFIHGFNWFQMLGLVMGTSLIAGLLGANHRGQLGAALLTVTLPPVIIQATTTESSLSAAAFLCYFVYFVLLWQRIPAQKLSLAAGVCLGLAGFAKLPVFIFAAPFLIGFFFLMWKTDKKQFWLSAFLIPAIIFCIHAPHLKRNFDLFRNPLGDRVFFERQKNQEMSAPLLVLNAFRNTGLLLTSPVRSANHSLKQLIENTHRAMGIPEDKLQKATDRMSKSPYFLNDKRKQASYIHTLLFLLLSCLFFIGSQTPEKKSLRAYWFALLIAFLAYAFIHKFNINTRRYLLPLLALSAPWSAAVWMSFSRRRWLHASASLMLMACLLFGFSATFSRAISHNPVWTNASPFPDKTMNEAAGFISRHHTRDIGLVLTGIDKEFPLLQALQQQGLPFRLEHVNVKNISNTISPPEGFRPGLIAEIHNHYTRKRPHTEWLTYEGKTYPAAWDSSEVTLFLTDSGKKNP